MRNELCALSFLTIRLSVGINSTFDILHFTFNMTPRIQINLTTYLLKWLLLSTVIGALIGSASAFFLWSLNWATNYREGNLWIITLLPLGGLVIGLYYHYFGEDVVAGNNQLLDEYHTPQKKIPFKMAPFVLFGTIITHLFGGSAGREGTAVQIGGAIADQFTKPLKLNKEDRRTLLMMGISGGFASVFGTPLAGTIFALEVLLIGKTKYNAILPTLLCAVAAHYFCSLWHVGHTHYHIGTIPALSAESLLWTIIVGIPFGLAAMAFSKSAHFWSSLFKSKIKYAPLRPVIGGFIIAFAVWLIGTTQYIGLGVPMIEKAFHEELHSYDFLVKILFTTFTLGAGFKGGEVTPLFFIGATLGNALSFIVPLPVGLLAGMGFVAVFSGATNTPIACTLMGIELFGADCAVYICIACVIAYLFSGHSSIYSSQFIGAAKHFSFARDEGKTIKEV